jgi:hypothetical protein
MIAIFKKKETMTYAELRHMKIPDGDASIYELIIGIVVRRASAIQSIKLHQEICSVGVVKFLYD